MHSFSLHHDHIAYFAVYLCFIAVCAAFASCLRPFAPKVPYSALILAAVSLIFALTFNADYYDVSPRHFAVATVLVFLSGPLLLLISAKRKKQAVFAVWHSANSLRELLACLFAWAAGLGLLVLPLAFAYAPTSLVTGHFICNDSVVHSIMTHGLGYMRSRGLDPFYYSAAPRGIHSFTYYFNSLLLGKPASRIILATSIASFSLIVLWADMLVRLLGVRTRYWLLLTLLPATPFLLSTTTYLLFLGQVSAMAMTLAAVTAACFFRRLGTTSQSLALFAFLSLGAITAYGLFSGSLIGFAVAICLASAVVTTFSPRYWLKELTEGFSELVSLRGAIVCGAVLLLGWPCLQFALYVLKVQGTGTVGSDMASAVGNLPDGYLSPLHLSGFWPPGVGYREILTKNWSAFANVLLVLVVAQAVCIATARFDKHTFQLLLTFFVPWLSSAIFINSPYVHFKYLTYLVPVFVLLAGIGFIRAAERVSESRPRTGMVLIAPCVNFFMLIYLGLSVWMPFAAASITPTVLEGHMLSFEAVGQEVSAKRALVLSREDWLQYYVQQDDIVPLTLYIPNHFHGQEVDVVVVDRAYKKDALEFLKPFPEVLAMVESGSCLKVIADRFESYSRSCEAKQ